MANRPVDSYCGNHGECLQIRSTGRAGLESRIRRIARDGTGIPRLECLSNALSELPETAREGRASLDPSSRRDRGRVATLPEL